MRRRTFLSLLLAAFCAGPAWPRIQAQVQAQVQAAVQEAWSDGPHLLWTGAKGEVLTVREGRLERRALGPRHLLALPGLPPLRLDPKGPGAPPQAVAEPPRLAALSDIHGNFEGMRALLQAQGIMDGAGRWTFGRGHLVVVGDVLDRGAQVTECCWLLRSLEAQAARQGGRVHMVMGNHEAMMLAGDRRYAHPKYRQLSAGLLPGLDALYGADSELGRWLRLRPALVRIGRTLFIHGGLSPRWLEARPSLAAVNERLAAAWRPGADEAAREAVLGPDGPLWYRGLIPGAAPKAGDASPDHVQALLRAFDADRVVVGHSTLEAVTAFHEGRVIGVDAGLKEGRRGELLLLEQGRAFRGLPDGRRVPLEQP